MLQEHFAFQELEQKLRPGSYSQSILWLKVADLGETPKNNACVSPNFGSLFLT